MQSKVTCPNCKNVCILNEYINHCKNCGFIFINMIKRLSDDETEEKSHTRRTGYGVDQLDG